MRALLKLGAKVLSTNLGVFNPYELNFAITYRCNSRCRTCGIWKLKAKVGNEMTIDEIKKFAAKIKFVHWIRLTGGEPFLRSDYVEIVRTLNNNLDLFMLTTPTNGTMPKLIYEKVRNVLKFFRGKYVVTVSLDGPKDVHDYIRGVECWDRCIETYKMLSRLQNRLKNKNFKVFFGYTISPYNVGRLEEALAEVKEILPEVGLKDFHVNIFQMSEIYYHNIGNAIKRKQVHETRYKEAEEAQYKKEAAREIDLCIRERSKSLDPISRIELRYLTLAKKYLRSGRTPLDCNIFNLSCFVDPSGNVYPCTIFNKRLGNLRLENYDLKKILCSKRAKAVMKDIIKKKCPHCWTPCEAHNLILSNWFRV